MSLTLTRACRVGAQFHADTGQPHIQMHADESTGAFGLEEEGGMKVNLSA